jgi:restriction endonuclease S subunit
MRMSSKVIGAGEMAPDHIITILSAADEDDASRSPFTGVPMKILAVDIPFLAVDVLAGNGGRLIIDTRLHSFMELKPEFAEVFKQPEIEFITPPSPPPEVLRQLAETKRKLEEEFDEMLHRDDQKRAKRAQIIRAGIFAAGVAIGFAVAHL